MRRALLKVRTSLVIADPTEIIACPKGVGCNVPARRYLLRGYFR